MGLDPPNVDGGNGCPIGAPEVGPCRPIVIVGVWSNPASALRSGQGIGGGGGGGGGSRGNSPQTSKSRAEMLCKAKLPDGRTVGDVVRANRALLSRLGSNLDMGIANIGTFGQIAQPSGSLDFKNTFPNTGKFDRETLGTYGNFAYYAIGVGNISAAILDAGAGAYGVMSVMNGTKPLSDLTEPLLSDRNAAAVRDAGLASKGCPK